MENKFSYGLLFHFLYLIVLKMVQVKRPTSFTQKSNRFSDLNTYVASDVLFLLSLIITLTIQEVATGPRPGLHVNGPGPKLYNEKQAGPKSYWAGPGCKILFSADLWLLLLF